MRQAWRRYGVIRALAVVGALGGFGTSALGGWVYKADNTRSLNDPLSWEGSVVPGPEDVAVFDERVTTNTLTFVVTDDLAWAGIVFTNQTSPVSGVLGTAVLTTNGTDAATLTLGAGGVGLSGSGLALSLGLPLALSAPQVWQLDRCNVTFNETVSGASDWTLDMPSQTMWNVASGYSGNLTITNAISTSRFTKSGRWAKTFTIKGGGRWEMTFKDAILWSDLFADRSASVTCWNGLTAGGTLQFEEGDTFLFPGGRFTIDNGYGIQNGGTLSGTELQVQYASYNARYTVNGGSLALTSGILIGNGTSSLSTESRFLQAGGTVSVNSVKVGWCSGNFWGLNTFELTGGVFRVTGPRGADSGVHLSWLDYIYTPASSISGVFLMRGGWADIDQIVLGRSIDNPAYAITNAYSMFKMTGGELLLGARGLYAGRTWNNGASGSAYAMKLQGGTLRAGDSWSSALDLMLSDADGGTVFNTADTNGVGRRIVLNGAVYGPGQLTKRGAGTLVLAGEAAYEGKTVVEAGTLAVAGTGSGPDCYRWTADSLAGTNNALVSEWPALNNLVTATNAVEARTPRLIRNELNGHSVVRFSNAAQQYLAIDAAESPISGATSFSIAVVFKTGTAGNGGAANWYSNTGLVDGEQGGIQNDWGLVYNSSGQVGGGAGFPSVNKDTTVYSVAGRSVANNQPHVAIYTWEGTNLTMNVDGRVTTAASTATTVAARNAYRLLFGSVNLENGKYFNGDMAEIRIYRNHALSPDEQNLIGSELAAAYGVSDALFEEPAIVTPSIGEMGVPSSPAGDTLPYEAVVWDADTLTGANGSAVNAWTSTNGACTATPAGVGKTGITAPTLVTDAFYGHNGVRFDGVGDALGIPAGDSPVAGSTNFTVALVFRTTVPGKDMPAWYSSVGLIDAEQASIQNDWGIAFSGSGRIMAGIGGPDATSLSKVYDLHDGMPHVAVIAYDALDGQTRIMVDGLDVVHTVAQHLTPRNPYRIVIGSLNALNGQFFTGDIAAFCFLPQRALTLSEMALLSTEMGTKFGVRPVSRSNTLNPQPTGLGRGDVEIAAGAALVVPVAESAPVTIRGGQTLRGAGAVRGTLAVADGGRISIDAPTALAVETLWLNDGAHVDWSHIDGIGGLLEVGSLSGGGTVTLHVTGEGNLPVRVPVIHYQQVEPLDTVTWNVSGGNSHTRVVLNPTTQTLDLFTARGTTVLIR